MALTQISTDGIKNGTITGSDLATNVDLVDNQKIRFGTGNDLEIYHNGFTSIIGSASHTLAFYSDTNHSFHNANGSETLAKFIPNGAVELYHDNTIRFMTNSTGAQVTGTFTCSSHFNVGDNVQIQLGNSGTNDFVLVHDGTDNIINCGNNGNLFQRATSIHLQSLSGEDKIVAETDGAVELYYNNSKKFETTSTGVTVTGTINFGSGMGSGLNSNGFNINFADSNGSQDMAKFGASGDLQIYHDGSHSRIDEVGTGNLMIQSNNAVFIKKGTSENIATFNVDDAVELYYNNVKKFQTTNGGINITGSVACSGGASNNLSLPDNGKAKFGTSDDLQIYHNGSHSVIQNDTGTLFTLADNLSFKNNANNETLITAAANGAVELYHNNSKKFQTESYGVQVFGNLFIADGGSGAGDNRIDIGNGSDFMIFHDGSTNIIDGRFHPIELRHQTEVHIKCVDDGAVELYHNNVKQMETTSGGASIRNHHKFDTGTVTQRSYLSSGNGINHRIMLAGAGTSNVQGQYIRAFANCANIDDSGTVKFVIFATGDCQNANNSFAGFSDVNLKQDITDAGSQWDDIKNLRVRKYRFKNNPTGPLQIGCIAQEAETVSPGLIDTDPEEGFKSLKYSVLYMKGIKCLQEAMARIEALETEVAALKAA